MSNSDGIQALIDFWDSFEPNSCQAPHVHPRDDAALLASVEREPLNVDLSVPRVEEHFRNLLNDGDRFHLSLTPVPYLGDLTSADVFLLLTNPVAGYADYGTDARPEFREYLARNLKQRLEGDARCLALDPKYWWSSWFAWFEKLLRRTVREYASAANKSYLAALDTLSRRLALIERVPYYSVNASRMNQAFIENLESAKVAKEAASALVTRAARGEVLVVVVWGAGRLDRPGRFGLNENRYVHLNTGRGYLDLDSRTAIVSWLSQDHSG